MKKKQPRDTLELTVDRGPRQAGIRRKARDAYLKELDLNPLNNNGIDQEIGTRINRAKSIHDRVGKPTDLEKYQFLSEVMAVFLLGSEPMSRRSKLKRVCIKEGVSARSNTRLLHLVVKALGRSRERRETHRDSMVLEYAMMQGITPSTLVSYLSTPGQGLDTTYDRAVGYFGGPNRRVRTPIIEEAEAQQRSQSVPVGKPYFGYFINTETSRVHKNCFTEPSLVKAVVDLIKQEIATKRLSSTKNSGIGGKPSVIGMRPSSQ